MQFNLFSIGADRLNPEGLSGYKDSTLPVWSVVFCNVAFEDSECSLFSISRGMCPECTRAHYAVGLFGHVFTVDL